MAESVFADMIAKRGLTQKIAVSSAATHTEEIGNPPHYGTVRKLNELNIPVVPHRARLLTRADGERYDYIIGMDQENLRHMRRILGLAHEGKISLLLDYTEHPRAISDPWYTRNFDETYSDICEGLEAFLSHLVREHKI